VDDGNCRCGILKLFFCTDTELKCAFQFFILNALFQDSNLLRDGQNFQTKYILSEIPGPAKEIIEIFQLFQCIKNKVVHIRLKVALFY
jgi:hypothetical protein